MYELEQESVIGWDPNGSMHVMLSLTLWQHLVFGSISLLLEGYWVFVGNCGMVWIVGCWNWAC